MGIPGASVNTPYQGLYRTKILYVNTEEHDKNRWFGDTKVAFKNHASGIQYFLYLQASVISIPTGEEGTQVRGEGITTVGQQLAFWIDMGHRICLHTF